VVRNNFGLHFGNSILLGLAHSPAGVPDTEPMTIDGAVGISPHMGTGGEVRIGVEWHDIFDKSGMTLAKRLAVGAEFHFRKKVFLRMGWGSGYPSFGIGVSKESSELSLSWYSEDVGTSAVPQQNTNFALQYVLRAF
ncbi:MAG TPA: hypothetical protein VL588_06280, partial [Bdellovibrionota bacterium]|nr:hypothetical protein [Bdellovibrionota bacterium]